MLFDDSFAYGQPNARSRVFAAVKPLEYSEDLLIGVRFNAQPVVTDRKRENVVCLLRRDVDAWRLWPAELDRIRNQLPEHLIHLGEVGHDMREPIVRNLRAAFANHVVESEQYGR